MAKRGGREVLRVLIFQAIEVLGVCPPTGLWAGEGA